MFKIIYFEEINQEKDSYIKFRVVQDKRERNIKIDIDQKIANHINKYLENKRPEISRVIFFNGKHNRNNISYLCFKIRQGMIDYKVEIPVDHYTGEYIMSQLQKIAPPSVKPVEHGNDEESL